MQYTVTQPFTIHTLDMWRLLNTEFADTYLPVSAVRRRRSQPLQQYLCIMLYCALLKMLSYAYALNILTKTPRLPGMLKVLYHLSLLYAVLAWCDAAS